MRRPKAINYHPKTSIYSSKTLRDQSQPSDSIQKHNRYTTNCRKKKKKSQKSTPVQKKWKMKNKSKKITDQAPELNTIKNRKP